MISCPRCHHLNPDGELGCELCGADLGTGQEVVPGTGQETEPVSAELEANTISNEPPVGESAEQPTVEPVAEPAEPPAEQPAEVVTGGNLASALLNALDQDPMEGRARGEGPQARGYFLRPLPVPDDIPVPTSGGRSVVQDGRGNLTPLPGQESSQISEPASTSGSFASSGSQNLCPRCGAVNPPNNRFCGGCGARLPEPDEEEPAPIEDATGKMICLVCINEDGSDGPQILVDASESHIGRNTDERFASDPFLSPIHARVLVADGMVRIEDLDSLNGTFVRIRDSVRLAPGDCFLMGRQVLRLETIEHEVNPKAIAGDGTRYMGSPIPGGAYKLVQIGIGGIEQNVYCLPAGGAVLGRERGDVTFPGDKFMSARHAQITTEQGSNVFLTDLNSSNGTWTRINQQYVLNDQDFIFLGQQLFRMQIG